MGGCQSTDARNAAIDANFPADSRHVMMNVKNDKDLSKMQEGTKTSQPDFKPRAGYQPRAAYQPQSAADSGNGMAALMEKKRAEQQQQQQQQASARTMSNSDDEKDTAAAGAERRGTDTTALDMSGHSD